MPEIIVEPLRSRPHGALRQSDGSCIWSIWAPGKERIRLVTWKGPTRSVSEMQPLDDGWFTATRTGAQNGDRYAFLIEEEALEIPDPASRWQPDGVNRPSALFFPEEFTWSDRDWTGVPLNELVIYELHIGTFTPQGTFAAAIERLRDLVDLGVTAVEVMPVSQFPGGRNWGYDGVHPYAVQNTYGGPRAFQEFVDAAHRHGLAVILDVVYNHLGPEGNYLSRFGPYFTTRYATPWGPALNYDGPHSDPVRQYVIDNACQWVRDFHVDGLRLDAIQEIYDIGAYPILQELQTEVQKLAASLERHVVVIGETDQNDVRQVTPASAGGIGLDAVWADDFHHALHALLTGERDGYYEDYGSPEQVAKTIRDVLAFDGGYSRFRGRRHGNRVSDTPRERFVVCIQNHDQVGNRADGARLASLVPPAAQRLLAGLLLISPCTPLLFMGEEYGETRPFPFFCSYLDEHLNEAVREGRRREFAERAFRWHTAVPDPSAKDTFASAVLNWEWVEGSLESGLRHLYQDLLRARREWPSLRNRQPIDAALLGDDQTLLFVQRGAGHETLRALANLSDRQQTIPETAGLQSSGAQSRLLLSTEDGRYGGGQTAAAPVAELGPYELQLWGHNIG